MDSSEPKPKPDAQPKERGAWRAQEVHVIPENRLWLVSIGLMCCVFLAALDQTIVAVGLPEIVKELGGGENYSWIGSIYLLTSAAISPFYAKLSDILGRKPVLHTSIILFLIGSALCGAAQNSTWLVACRAVQGLGGGGIMQLVSITIGDIVPLEKRAFWNSIIGATWGLASVFGPLIGGLFTDHLTWRWCFFINLPFGGAAAVILFFFLNLNPHHGRTFKEHVKVFDFIGLALIVSGVVCLLLGFHFSETAWKSPETISLLTIGVVLLVSAGTYECYTTKSPIIPPRLFKTRTTAAILIFTFLHAVAFVNGAYYLPLYFQVLGATATGAGIRMLSFSLGASVFSAIGGLVVSKTKEYRILLSTSWALFCVGYGLMTTLDSHSNLAKNILYPLVSSIGIGPLFMVPLVALQAAMPQREMALSSAALIFVRMIGSTVGIAVGQVIFVTTLTDRLAHVSNLSIPTSAAGLSESVKHLRDIPDLAQREQVIQAFAKSVSSIWVVMTPIVGVGFLLSLLLRTYSLQSATRKASDLDQIEKADEKGSQTLQVNVREVDSHAVSS